MHRWLMAGVALAFPLIGVLAYMGTASASNTTGVSCTGLKGTLLKGKVTIAISGCNDKANTGGKGTEKTTELGSTGTIAWSGGEGTTKYDDSSYSGVSDPTCPSTDSEDESTGKITGGTGAAEKSIKKGWSFQAYVCYDASTGALTLAPGTHYLIGPGL
jgi:hypothetical protein